MSKRRSGRQRNGESRSVANLVDLLAMESYGEWLIVSVSYAALRLVVWLAAITGEEAEADETLEDSLVSQSEPPHLISSRSS